MHARGAELGDGGEPAIGADGGQGRDAKEQEKQRRHECAAAHSGEADDEAGCGAGEDEHQVHIFIGGLIRSALLRLPPLPRSLQDAWPAASGHRSAGAPRAVRNPCSTVSHGGRGKK